jgi:hypothetical protein
MSAWQEGFIRGHLERSLRVITGTTSGLGLGETARALINLGNISWCAPIETWGRWKLLVAKEGFDPSSYSVLEFDLHLSSC